MHNQVANDIENSISLDDSQIPPSITHDLKEEDRPANWPSSKKWSIVVSTSLATFVVSFGSSVYSAAIPHIQTRFHVTPDTALLGITLYVIGFALGPMAWGPASELYGKRRPLFLGYAIFCICQLPCALAQNMPLLLTFRFLSGLAGSSSLAILGGMYVDFLSRPAERGISTAIFSVATFCGPTIGPIIGNLTTLKLGWRWTAWLTLIGGVIFGSVAFLLTPETSEVVILRQRSKGNTSVTPSRIYRPERGISIFVQSYLTKPVRMFVREPILIFFTIYMSLAYGIIYLTFTMYPLAFVTVRGWSRMDGSLPFIGMTIGVVLACIGIALHSIYYIQRSRVHLPERRLPPMIAGSILLSAGIFWFGWTSNRPRETMGIDAVKNIKPAISTTYYCPQSFLAVASSISSLFTANYLSIEADMSEKPPNKRQHTPYALLDESDLAKRACLEQPSFLDTSRLQEPAWLNPISSSNPSQRNSLSPFVLSDKGSSRLSPLGHQPIGNEDTVMLSDNESDQCCFGEVLTLSEDLSHVPIELRFSGHVISLHVEGSGNYMGRIESKAIVDVVEDYQVTLATTLECPPVKKKKSADSFQTPKTLHIVAYGLRKDMNEIGDILEDSELFLQYPTEYDTRLEYLNPQYLLRPGATIPRADSATFQAIAKHHSPEQVMEEKAKSEVHRAKNESARDMGLGKTLSTLALVSWFLDVIDNSGVPETRRTTLIVAPNSSKHIVPDQIRVLLFHGHTRDRLAKSLMEHDLVLTTYGTLQSEWRSKKGDSPLFTQTWARVVLDEAHHIRERSTQTFRAVTALRTSRRWCLTGTPIQNRLDDYGALLSFIGVPPFISKSVFDFWIMKPVVQGNAEGLRRLKNLVGATCLRRTKDSVSETLNLPDRKVHECVVQLDPEDRELYDFFKRNASHLIADRGFGESNTAKTTGSILPIINTLRLICNHGQRLLPNFALEAWSHRNNPNSESNFAASKFGLCISCGMETLPNEMLSEFVCSHFLCSKCADSDERYQLSLDSDLCPSCTKDGDSAVTDAATEEGVYQPSAKIRALIQSLRVEQQGNTPTFGNKPIKSVVFTFWRKMLDLLEFALRSEGFKSSRIDGQKSLVERTSALRSFRNDDSCTVMIATIGSIGEGVDLTAANFVHLVEPHWNPMLEEQALDRVHRMGQIRDVVATRYITNDSIEMLVKKIKERKLDLINSSLGHLSGLADMQN
ncbi:hypothetical protein F25303_11892 [Fusarium sp. NRRL 25303]|nr:hypothetical protein F25303_11892 [Fusarium sp. NRRL 25303]